MKYSILTILTLTLSTHLIANDERSERRDNRQRNHFAEECVTMLAEHRQSGAEEKNERLINCENAEAVSKNFGKSSIANYGTYQTADGRAVCQKKAGFTLDYQSCASTAQMYDYLLVAAQALEIQAELRAQHAQKEATEKVQQKALAGDVQGAGLSASKDNSSTMKQINQERAAAYTAAVAALGAKLAAWKDDAEDVCKEHGGECLTQVQKVQESTSEDEVFANRNIKSIFTLALAEFTAKGLEAGILASQYKTKEEAVAKIQETYEEDLLDIQFDECAMNPMAKECLGPGERIAGESYSSGTGSFAVGGGGSNSFDLGSGTDEFGELGDVANIESQQVAGINSPFKDQIKEANDILDQAGAASAGSGGQAPAGGGAGGGGMGGGGSASLGNDTKTPDETPEEAEIKAKKASAGYASAGAKGFSGVKSSKEDSNPFASLFDQKGSAGGLEEDRSIASNDIDDKSSVLFQKISKKYSEMHSSKRIEANNLELE